MGTITGIGDLDPIRWPKSDWRCLKVGWDESTAGERQQRVSIWDIEPLPAPFLLCPPPLALRSKRTRGSRGEEDIESWLKKSQMWAGGSDSLGLPDFHSLGMDSSMPRMRPPQQRLESAVPSPQNEFYCALAAEALQEIRTRDSSKQFHPQSLLSSQQLHFQSQQQDQQSMHQMVDASGPLLQLSFSGPQPQVDLVCSMRPETSYCESELQMVPSSFSLQGLLGTTARTNSPTRENNHFFNILRPNQSEMQTSIQGTDLIVQDPQVSPWFSTMQNQNQTDAQPMGSTQLGGQADSSPCSQVMSPFTHPQCSQVSVEAGLAELSPLGGFRDNEQDGDQLQADRHLLFGVPIDQPLTASAPLNSHHTYHEKTREQQDGFPGRNILQGAFCPPATPDHPTIAASGVISTGGMDNNGVYQRNSVASWSSMQAAPPPPLRTFTKVENLFQCLLST
jgi:hypothetical protein